MLLDGRTGVSWRRWCFQGLYIGYRFLSDLIGYAARYVHEECPQPAHDAFIELTMVSAVCLGILRAPQRRLGCEVASVPMLAVQSEHVPVYNLRSIPSQLTIPRHALFIVHTPQYPQSGTPRYAQMLSHAWPAILPPRPSSSQCCLCATDEDVVDGDVYCRHRQYCATTGHHFG